MTQEKKEKLFISGTALAVLVIILGVIIFISQVVMISNRKKELRALNREIAILNELISEDADEIAIWQQQATVEEMARRLGYKYPEDVEKV